MSGLGGLLSLFALGSAPDAYQTAAKKRLDMDDQAREGLALAAMENAAKMAAPSPQPQMAMPQMGGPPPGPQPQPPMPGAPPPQPPMGGPPGPGGTPPPQFPPPGGPPQGIPPWAARGLPGAPPVPPMGQQPQLMGAGQPQMGGGPMARPPMPPGPPGGAPPGAGPGPPGSGGMPQVPPGMYPAVRQQGQPQEDPAIQQARQQGANIPPGGFDWRQLLKQIMDANPDMKPGVAAAAMNKLLPFMQMQSKTEWLQAHNQFLEQQLATRTAVQARGQDIGLEKTRETQGGAMARNPNAQAFEDFLNQNPKATPEQQASFIRSLKGGQQQGANNTGGLGEDEIDSIAKRVANYQQAPYSGASRGIGAAVMARVEKFNPNYDAKEWGKRNAGEKAFGTGKQSDTVRSIGTAYRHLDTLSQLGEALANGDTQVINRVANTVSAQMGGAPPTTFDAAKQIVAAEVVKAITATGGGVKERTAAEERISSASSPAQLAGIINDAYKPLLEGQLTGFRQQYKNSTGKEDFDEKFMPKAAEKSPAGSDGTTKTIGGKTYVKKDGKWYEQ